MILNTSIRGTSNIVTQKKRVVYDDKFLGIKSHCTFEPSCYGYEQGNMTTIYLHIGMEKRHDLNSAYCLVNFDQLKAAGILYLKSTREMAQQLEVCCVLPRR